MHHTSFITSSEQVVPGTGTSRRSSTYDVSRLVGERNGPPRPFCRGEHFIWTIVQLIWAHPVFAASRFRNDRYLTIWSGPLTLFGFVGNSGPRSKWSEVHRTCQTDLTGMKSFFTRFLLQFVKWSKYEVETNYVEQHSSKWMNVFPKTFRFP